MMKYIVGQQIVNSEVKKRTAKVRRRPFGLQENSSVQSEPYH